MIGTDVGGVYPAECNPREFSPGNDTNYVLILKKLGYEFYRDLRDDSLLIHTSEYRPGNIVLTKEGLENLIELLK